MKRMLLVGVVAVLALLGTAGESFNRQLMWQSNASRCGPASIANVNRSLGDRATSEARVLADTGRCWSGFCILGLTLDELAEVARKNSPRKVTVLGDLSAEEFPEHLRRSNDPASIANVNRSLGDRATSEARVLAGP
jgi:hypothetical protein